jgi:protein-tyrosine phosphatase
VSTPSVPCHVLVVCGANKCRSPLAQAGLTAALRRVRGTRWRIGSAGTHATDGGGLLPQCRELIPDGAFGADRFRTRALTPALLAEADVVITMTREQAEHVLRLEPLALRRTVTLAELARCAVRTGRVEGHRGRDALLHLMRLTIRDRGPLRPLDPAEDDIEDPVRNPAKLLPGVARRIEDAVAAIADAVNGGGPESGKVPAPRPRSGRPFALQKSDR